MKRHPVHTWCAGVVNDTRQTEALDEALSQWICLRPYTGASSRKKINIKQRWRCAHWKNVNVQTKKWYLMHAMTHGLGFCEATAQGTKMTQHKSKGMEDRNIVGVSRDVTKAFGETARSDIGVEGWWSPFWSTQRHWIARHKRIDFESSIYVSEQKNQTLLQEERLEWKTQLQQVAFQTMTKTTKILRFDVDEFAERHNLSTL